MSTPLPLRERVEYLIADLRAGKTSARAFALGDITLSDYVASMLEQAVAESPDNFAALRGELEALKSGLRELDKRLQDHEANIWGNGSLVAIDARRWLRELRLIEVSDENV